MSGAPRPILELKEKVWQLNPGGVLVSRRVGFSKRTFILSKAFVEESVRAMASSYLLAMASYPKRLTLVASLAPTPRKRARRGPRSFLFQF